MKYAKIVWHKLGKNTGKSLRKWLRSLSYLCFTDSKTETAFEGVIGKPIFLGPKVKSIVREYF
jgi:hypothetical protein